MARFAFKRGWDQVPKGKAKDVKRRIKGALGITSDGAFYARMKGTPEPTVSQHREVSEIFRKTGITDPWGD